jgi:hypothetical protein
VTSSTFVGTVIHGVLYQSPDASFFLAALVAGQGKFSSECSNWFIFPPVINVP